MRRVMLVLLFVVLLGAACGGAEEDATAVRDVSLTATDIAYDAIQLDVPVNQPVRLTLANDGVLEHDFTIREIAVEDVHAPAESEADDHEMTEDVHDLALHVAAPANGGQAVLEFTPTEAGEYEYYCTVSGHKEAGMVGTLVVGP